MKLRTKDPRAEPLPLILDDQGLAEQVQAAPTAEAAWELLGLPGGRKDLPPEAVAALAAAATALCATSDAIGLGLRHFGELDADEDAPAAWIDRMVELYVQELEGFWRFDELAYAGLHEGGWTATHAVVLADPAERLATRARWQAEPLKPTTPALWWDRLDRVLTEAVASGDAEPGWERPKREGRSLVAEAARHRFSHWRTTRRIG